MRQIDNMTTEQIDTLRLKGMLSERRSYISNEEFRNRLRRLIGSTSTVTGAAKSDPCLVRKPTDRGYNKEVTK